MTRFLLAAASVHATAAACDYLGSRVVDGDAVVALAVTEPGGDPRDGADAVNVARARLAGVPVDAIARDGDPAGAILSTAAAESVDEIVIGPRRGGPGAVAALGTTARRVLADADRPVVVVPLPDPD